MIPFRKFVEDLEEEDFFRLKNHVDSRFKKDFADFVDSEYEKNAQKDDFFELMGAITARFFSGLKELFHLFTD